MKTLIDPFGLGCCVPLDLLVLSVVHCLPVLSHSFESEKKSLKDDIEVSSKVVKSRHHNWPIVMVHTSADTCHEMVNYIVWHLLSVLH